MSTITKGSLGSILSARLFAAKEFEETISKIYDREQSLKDELLNVATKKVRDWLREEGIITDLFKFGKSSRKIYFDENGFGNFESTRKTLEGLQKVWEGVVNIELNKNPEPHCVKINFKVLM